ncbi:hypothetical protein HBA54_21960 [Pelagibius litoralis]|uniref:Uncharacterized protein n=1 Tax=Pelagibius litoralis TaxID=374515 RepID=A0A967F1F1_9PROT|nr:hypothetical protein [Pelagibius litoralis]NIA71269.1 hypothetical protein [Pelagibius litoralis]
MRKLNVSLLSNEEVDRAYPLVQTVLPDASIEAWRRFAEARLAREARDRAGILSVRNEQSCIVGLGAYLLAEDLLHGPILFADHFCALDIMDPTSVARALVRAIERVAEQQGCSAIHTTLMQTEARGADSWISNVLHERGHCVKGLQMCKLIASATRPVC